MQIELGKHKAELECRQAAASTTLERVMKEQASAELKRDEACRTARALEARRAEISERTSAVKVGNLGYLFKHRILFKVSS